MKRVLLNLLVALILGIRPVYAADSPVVGGGVGGGSGGASGSAPLTGAGTVASPLTVQNNPSFTVNSLPVVVSSSAVNTGGTSPVTITAPTSITDGNALWATVSVNNVTSETWTPPAGFTQIGSNVVSTASSKTVMAVFCKVAASESGNYAFAYGTNGNAARGVMANVSGNDCTTDGTSTAAANASTITMGAVSPTPTKVNDLVLIFTGQVQANVTGGTFMTSPLGTTVKTISGGAIFSYGNQAGATPSFTVKFSQNASNDITSSTDSTGMAVALTPTVTASVPASTEFGAAVLNNSRITNGFEALGPIQATGGLIIGNNPGGAGDAVANTLAFRAVSTGFPFPMMILNGNNNLGLDPNNHTTFVQIGSGISYGPNFLTPMNSGLWGITGESLSDNQYFLMTLGNDSIFGNSVQFTTNANGAFDIGNTVFETPVGENFAFINRGSNTATPGTVVTGLSEATNTVTITVAAVPASITTGTYILLTGVNDALNSHAAWPYNGVWLVTGTSGTTITYTNPTAGLASNPAVSKGRVFPLVANMDATGHFAALGGGTVGVQPETLASFPACASTSEGSFATQTDSAVACVAGVTAAAGGSTHCQMYCNGSNWVRTGL